MSEKKLGIIKDAGFGLRDLGFPCLFFTVDDGFYSYLQIISDYKEIKRILQDGNVYDVSSLNGKSCWIEHENNKTFFVKMANIL